MAENSNIIPTKTPKTAIVIIPPEACQERIQRIRRAHDCSLRRWMPHITLLFPFRPAEDFDEIEAQLQAACEAFQPFDIELTEFRFFRHARNRCTVWLAPEPEQLLIRFQSHLWRVVPECDDVRNHQGGYRPHLSVGQSPNISSCVTLIQKLSAEWAPVRFRVSDIAMIRRGDPPDDVFAIDRKIPLF